MAAIHLERGHLVRAHAGLAKVAEESRESVFPSKQKACHKENNSWSTET